MRGHSLGWYIAAFVIALIVGFFARATSPNLSAAAAIGTKDNVTKTTKCKTTKITSTGPNNKVRGCVQKSSVDLTTYSKCKVKAEAAKTGNWWCILGSYKKASSAKSHPQYNDAKTLWTKYMGAAAAPGFASAKKEKASKSDKKVAAKAKSLANKLTAIARRLDKETSLIQDPSFGLGTTKPESTSSSARLKKIVNDLKKVNDEVIKINPKAAIDITLSVNVLNRVSDNGYPDDFTFSILTSESTRLRNVAKSLYNPPKELKDYNK